jgi:hypothetical protein
MGQIWIREFTGGLDTRRLPETTTGGVLIKATNGHISRGGEFQKRAAFVSSYALPVGQTKGLAATLGGIYVFGDAAAPAGIPDGVTYQRLASRSGSPLARVNSFDLYAGKLYVAAEFADGTREHFYDGVRVEDWYDGRARATLQVAGSAGGSLTALTVNGAPQIGGPVAWSVSNENTAAAIADAINAFIAGDDDSATAVGDKVNVIANAGATANGYAVATTAAGALTINPATTTMAGGSDNADTYVPGDYVRTLGSKEYSLSGPNLHFSGIQEPTKWTTDTVGAGFIDMSTYASGAELLTSIAPYQDNIAVFAERLVIIEYVDPDPTLNKQVQVLRNTGTGSPRSVTQFGDNDLFYLDESGVRSLRARDASNAAATTDIGVPVDTLVVDKLRSLAAIDRANIIGIIEPRDGRFWIAIKDVIFVFSFFSGAKVSAWTTYEPGFDVQDMVVFQRRVYVRSGDTIYVYGGLGAEFEYDDTAAEAWLPLLDADKPTEKKTLTGVDAAIRGTWEVRVNLSLNDDAATDKIGIIDETSYDGAKISARGEGTHIGLRFKSVGTGPATLGAAVIHFEGEPDDD